MLRTSRDVLQSRNGFSECNRHTGKKICINRFPAGEAFVQPGAASFQELEKERETETDSDRDRQTATETDRQTETQTATETDREYSRVVEWYVYSGLLTAQGLWGTVTAGYSGGEVSWYKAGCTSVPSLNQSFEVRFAESEVSLFIRQVNLGTCLCHTTASADPNFNAKYVICLLLP